MDMVTQLFEAALGCRKDDQLSKRAESFCHQMDSLKWTNANLDDVVFSTLIQEAFYALIP